MTKYIINKLFALVLISALALFTLTACGGSSEDPGASGEAESADESTISIVATIFPEYDWVKNILGDNPGDAELTLLLGDGVDLHSFQPTVDDILTISNCDVFIYVGGESDAWVKDALREARNENMLVINLMEVLGASAREEEAVEGMQDDDSETEEDTDEPEYDEHVWLSLKNAEIFVNYIEGILESADPANADVYKANAESYTAELAELDSQYEAAISEAPVKTLLFGDRFPFRYLTEDYGLEYYAAFKGCSAESEASFETITFLAKKLEELGLGAVVTTEISDGKLASTIIQSTASKDQVILTLDSMQSIALSDVDDGAAYVGIMKANLETLKEALK